MTDPKYYIINDRHENQNIAPPWADNYETTH